VRPTFLDQPTQMAKLSLKLDDLHVTSFTPGSEGGQKKGTIRGQERLTYAKACESYTCPVRPRTDEETVCEWTCDQDIYTCGYCVDDTSSDFC
jgi:hypothetical protein